MSDDASGHEIDPDAGATDDADGWEATGAPTTGSTLAVHQPVPRSWLVGFMAVPISRALPVRRSTVLMLVAFLGFGTLTYLYPPDGAATSGPSATTSGGTPGFPIPLATPTTTTSTTRPASSTTTTTKGTGSTTTLATPTTTTSTTRPASSTTTTTRGTGSTTTTSVGVTTTTATSSP